MHDSSSIVVGILYPSEWFGSARGFAAEIAAIEALDPRVDVVTVAYVEPHEVRTARGAAAGEPPSAQPIDADDLATLSRLDVALAIDIPPNITEIAPGLAWVQAVGAGTAHLQAAGLAEAGVVLTSNGGSNSIGIAEFVVGRLIEFNKRFAAIAALQAAHDWTPLYGAQISGQTLGLIGYGAINQAVAHRAAAFGMKVLVARRTPTGVNEPPIEATFATGDLHEMLGLCDAVIAAVPETVETEGLMSADAFAAMRRGAFFANVGRGSLVDEAALIASLESGHLGGAAIDVALVEPLPSDNPLWDASNLAISGHCSSVPTALMGNVHRLFRENLDRFLRGKDLMNVVSADRGY